MTLAAKVIALDTNATPDPAISSGSITLRETVRRSVRAYLGDLGDHDPDELYQLVLDQVEKPLLEEVMRWSGQNQSKTAVALGMSRGTLRKKLRLHGLN